jgi:16S rRNA processing protein RimM
MDNYFSIGKLVATFGLKGELVLRHSLGKKTALKGLQTIFLEDRKDSFLPYFIEETRVKNEQEIFVKLEGVEVKETAQKLVQKEIWLLEKDFQRFAAKTAPLSMLGFSLVNAGKTLGEVLEVIEQPHQVLLRILYNNKEALIPIHNETLDSIDQARKIVYLKLPDGLMDIYS